MFPNPFRRDHSALDVVPVKRASLIISEHAISLAKVAVLCATAFVWSKLKLSQTELEREYKRIEAKAAASPSAPPPSLAALDTAAQWNECARALTALVGIATATRGGLTASYVSITLPFAFCGAEFKARYTIQASKAALH